MSLIARLAESTLFVSSVTAEELFLVRGLATQNRRHGEALSNLIVEMGDIPWPPTRDVRSADLHFQELRFLLPRLIADLKRLVAAYRHAAPQLAAKPRAASLVNRIVQRHEQDIAVLESRL